MSAPVKPKAELDGLERHDAEGRARPGDIPEGFPGVRRHDMTDGAGRCLQCGSAEHVLRDLPHHTGLLPATEWVHGINCAWSFACCGAYLGSEGQFCRPERPTHALPEGGQRGACAVGQVCARCFHCGCEEAARLRTEQLEAV